MPRSDRRDMMLPKLLTPAGGMVLSLLVSGVLWSGMVIGMHMAGVF